MEVKELKLGKPNPKQREFLLARERFIAYGGARGGGKSWAVRTKAIAGAARWPKIRILICRHTYPELESTVIEPMLETLGQVKGGWKYKSENRTLRFANGSIKSLQRGDAGGLLGRIRDLRRKFPLRRKGGGDSLRRG